MHRKVGIPMSASTIFNSDYVNVQPLELIDRSIGKRVLIITEFGYEIDGILMGIDPQVNCVLSEADETRPTGPNFAPRHHSIILVNGSTISIVFPFLISDHPRTGRRTRSINDCMQPSFVLATRHPLLIYDSRIPRSICP
jgi:small nuclear ribonucleoprotein (snRNP)-like protein